MNIGFDADGVIFPIEDFQIKEGLKYFKKREIVDENGYGIKEVFDCTNKEEFNFWLSRTVKYHRQVVSTEGIGELISKLRMEGNRVYIITSHAKATENNPIGFIMRKLLEYALKRNNIQVDGIIYTSTDNSEQDKYDAIEKYNISIMIDDKKEINEKIKSITNTICFETRNNKDYYSENVFKASSSKELDEIIHIMIDDFKKSRKTLLDYKIVDGMSREDKILYYEELRKSFYEMRDPFLLEKGDKGSIRIINKLQKAYNFVYRPHIIHKEKFPKEKGIILAANHLHAFDPLLVMSATKKVPFHLLAKSELLDNPIWRYLFTEIGSFFVDNQDDISRKKVKEELIKCVLNDGIIMMFPEGTRNKTTNRLLPFHLGTVNIAQITGRPIYPFGINKDYRVLKNNLTASIGDPMYVSPDDNLLEKNKELTKKISILLDEIDTYNNSK